MTPQITTVLAILALAVILFVTEKIRVDLVALLVLVILALTGLVTPAEALSGFSNLAVVTVWAVLILSAGLARTGVAGLVGRPLQRLAGDSEPRLIALIMLTVGVLSGFMNSIGVAALLMPVVVDIARRTGRPPSRLLMPLAFAALLGGLNTLIGTPANLLVSEVLRDFELTPFGMFDYTPIGLVAMLAGTLYMVFVGRHLLPNRDIKDVSTANGVEAEEFFELHEYLFVIRLPDASPLAGRSLAKSRLGAALGLNVLAILRPDQYRLAPGPGRTLRGGDRLLVEGSPDRLIEMREQRTLVFENHSHGVEELYTGEIIVTAFELAAQSSLLGKSLEEADFRRHLGVIVLAIRRNGRVLRTNLEKIPLQHGDILLVQGTRGQLAALREVPGYLPCDVEPHEFRLEERLVEMRVPEGSLLDGKTLVESRLGEAFGLGVMGIIRDGSTQLMPAAEMQLLVGDRLMIKARPDDLLTLRGLQSLEIDKEPPPDLSELESEQVGLAEVVLSPHSTMAGKTLYQTDFREKFGLSVLAIWRNGRPHRANLRDMPLRFGDALLLYGRRDKLRRLNAELDFLVLTEAAQTPPRREKAPLALGIMALVLLPVILGWISIAIAAVAGVVLMILTGCLTMDEAYSAIEWKAVFLIAGMLPLGIAMEQTGAANFLAEGVVNLVGGLGPLAVTASLFILTALATQVMPNPAVVVLLGPVAVNTATDLGISPYSLMMAVAISASAVFLSPVGHPANVLILGPGGYRFSDYTKVGLPLILVVLAVVLLVLPLIWPF